LCVMNFSQTTGNFWTTSLPSINQLEIPVFVAFLAKRSSEPARRSRSTSCRFIGTRLRTRCGSD
jgi:hypothetical protein